MAVSVPIIENWTDIVGVVGASNPAPDLPEFTAVEIDVEKAEPVEGYPNLLESAEGTRITVLMPSSLVDSIRLSPGSVVQCRVRRAGRNRVFVHRQHISVHHRE